jgi:hypothetical protein
MHIFAGIELLRILWLALFSAAKSSDKKRHQLGIMGAAAIVLYNYRVPPSWIAASAAPISPNHDESLLWQLQHAVLRQPQKMRSNACTNTVHITSDESYQDASSALRVQAPRIPIQTTSPTPHARNLDVAMSGMLNDSADSVAARRPGFSQIFSAYRQVCPPFLGRTDLDLRLVFSVVGRSGETKLYPPPHESARPRMQQSDWSLRRSDATVGTSTRGVNCIHAPEMQDGAPSACPTKHQWLGSADNPRERYIAIRPSDQGGGNC